METLTSPASLNFEGNLAENWKLWIQKFRLYSKASGLNTRDEDVQIATLLQVIGEQALIKFNTFNLTAEEKSSFGNVVKAFEDYFCPQTNECICRQKFFARKQAEGESFNTFLTDLKELSLLCEFGPLKDSFIRDAVVAGIRDYVLSQKLLTMPLLTLEKAIAMCNGLEPTETQNNKESSGKGGAGGGAKRSGSGYEIMNLSPELAALVGQSTMARPEVVKKVWSIIKERDLYDPKDKMFAICDDALFKVIGVKRFRTIGMIKYLEGHFISSTNRNQTYVKHVGW